MYLWKCWRDTRIKFLACLALFLCLEVAFIFGHKVETSHPLGAADLHTMFTIVSTAVGSILVFLGWILGDENVGADIGRGSGDFLLTRPESRGTFVWIGWSLSVVETIVLWIVFSAIVFVDILSLSHQLGVSASAIMSSLLDFSKHDMPLMFLIFVINVGLIFGVTYFIGVVLRSGTRALVGSAALIFGYQILKAIFTFRFHIVLPDILLAYPNPHNGMLIPAVHEFIIRGLVALAFPVVAHVILERMEI
jgi:hypothetical protein